MPDGGEQPEIELVAVSDEAAAAILAGDAPTGVEVPDDYPTEFSSGVAAQVGNEGSVGPFFIRADGLVVGEIGGALIDDATIEVGYAIVESRAGEGHATAGLRQFTERATEITEAARIVAHTPPDRPASGRVVEKAGFDLLGQVQDEHEGEVLTVEEWELRLR